MKCKDCIYHYKSTTGGCCTLSNLVRNSNAEIYCSCFNKDLSSYDICYNCKYYLGGHDWGLFCSHKEKYNHIGRFNDEPCELYER